MGDREKFEHWLSEFLEFDAGDLERTRYTDEAGVQGYLGLEKEGHTEDADDLASIAIQAWQAAPRAQGSKPVACVTDLGLGNGDRVVQWYVDPLPDGALLYAAPVPVITGAMIEAGAQRLVSWEDNCTWPDSWGPMTVAAARQDAERVIRSALNVAGGGDEQH